MCYNMRILIVIILSFNTLLLLLLTVVIIDCRNAGPVGAAIDSQRYGTVIDGPEDVTASLGYWPPSCDDAALFSRQINTQLELFSIQ